MPPSEIVENSTKSSKVQWNVSVIVTGNFVALRLGYSIIEIAFQNQLNTLYNNDLIDTNAEIKVFEAMLKSDGLLDNSISVKKDGEA